MSMICLNPLACVSVKYFFTVLVLLTFWFWKFKFICLFLFLMFVFCSISWYTNDQGRYGKVNVLLIAILFFQLEVYNVTT